MLHLPPPTPADSLGRHERRDPTIRAAFEIPLQPDGRAQREGIRLLGWHPGTDLYALGRLYGIAAGSEWEPSSSPSRHALLILDGVGQVPASPEVAEFAALVRRAHAARRAAAAALPGADEHDLDCILTDLRGLRSRLPFLHDEIEGWETLEPRLRQATAAAASTSRTGSGVWVCRAARSSHMGQFIFLDHDLQVLGVARYWLGE
ncbi:MAG: hypothetical protein JSW67_08990 [Candidatus Latescibacterota bacterium]|nr:MAG: hypothetical protein JSW67_08990 [Candidatus Latescibacterota bacterium]